LNPAVRETVLTDFKPLPGSKIGELAATWDIVMGRTATELDQEPVRGGISRPEARGRGGRGRGR
jgi:protocatechuate 3,4-dioxygenase beta subunit